MNGRILFFLLLLAAADLKLAAQGTAFNYQGRLNVSGSPATAAYDFRFAVYDAVTNGNAVSISVTNSAVGVTNGLFSVTLDFGAGVFTGTNYWLDIAVRAVGVTPFTPLFPRQPILPVPYAVFATSASNLLGTLPAAQISGTLTSAQLAGNYSGAVNFGNSANTFSGAFSGNGSSLSNLNASQLTSGTVADARLSTNVALLNAPSQIFGGNNQFNGANSFTNFGNSFSGSFFGNGLVGWITVGGQSQTAVRDTGYMLTNSGLVTVTLPLNSAVTNGDIVRVSGAGGGGWLIAVNSGQSIIGNFASYANSTVPRLLNFPVSSTLYEDVAASADGTRIYFTGSGAPAIDISVASGIVGAADNGWTGVSSSPSLPYYSVACSASGKIVYAELNNLNIQISTNGGATWAATTTNAPSLTSIACSADGSKLFYDANYACSGDGTYRAKLVGGATPITISTNNGGNYSVNVTGPGGTVSCLAASSDCTRLLVGITNGLLYASSNQGKTWTPLAVPNQGWTGAWMSPDGSKFAATANATASVSGAVYFGEVSAQPDTSTTNTICGSRGAAVELQYLGGGKFMPVSSTGLIWAN